MSNELPGGVSSAHSAWQPPAREGGRPRYRPPTGVPSREQRRWQGWLVSLLAHLLFLGLIIFPVLQSDFNPRHAEGAGGAGPAGGGGGGSPGAAAATQERLRFVGLPTPPSRAAVAPALPTPTPPPIQPPKPKPVVQPPAPSQSLQRPPTPSQPASVASSTPGVGNGGANAGAGQNGSGPGSGGGVGSGEGQGRGSAAGPGTGGGNATIYPPTAIQMFLPPLPPPRELRGFHLTAWFDVDSLGKSTLLRFTPSPNGDYNKRLKETLLALKFRPAVRPDGVPVRDTVDVQFLF